MTPEQVREQVEHIRVNAHIDPEARHCEQDTVYIDVLQAIADGADNPRELAAEAVKIDDIDFPRWYA